MNKIIKELNNGIYPHSKPFNISELKNLGLRIDNNIPEKINNIFSLLSKLECSYN